MEILPKHRVLLDQLRDNIPSRRALIIGIDGLNGVGKSTLARFLSWQLEMPTLELDMFMIKSKKPTGTNTPPGFNLKIIKQIIEERNGLNRPIIVEGVFLLDVLKSIEKSPDILIFVTTTDTALVYDAPGSLRARLQPYMDKYDPQSKANYCYETNPEDFNITNR